MEIEALATRPGPAPARPVFSNQDFKILRKALVHYLKTVDSDPDLVRMSHLHHRLGRLG